MITKAQMHIGKILSLIEAEGLEGPGFSKVFELAKRPEPFNSLLEYSALLEIEAGRHSPQAQVEINKVANLAEALHYLYKPHNLDDLHNLGDSNE